MEKVIFYTTHLPYGECCEIGFWDVFFDETWADGYVECSEEVYEKVGGLNQKLHEKQNYEFLLRVAKYFSIMAIGVEDSKQRAIKDKWESWRTDCYIVGKYQQEMMEQGYFDLVVSELLTYAFTWNNPQKAICLLESMISRTDDYYEIDDNTCPFLVFYGGDTCYNVLKLMMDELINALHQCQQRVEIFNVEKEDEQSLTKYIGRHFKAVIGIQSCLFSVRMVSKKYLHDLIIAPKYNIILDHPAVVKDIITEAPKDYYLLLHDRNYISFAEKYFPNISGCVHFPCAGVIPNGNKEKNLNISFIGTYGDYREKLKDIRNWEKSKRFLGARFLRIMKQNPDYPAEMAFKIALEYYKYSISDDEFLDLFYEMRACYLCMMRYWREKVVVTLINAGLELHVYSETWQQSPVGGDARLICHPAVDVISSMKIMQQSKISLNIMSGHKDGITERVLNAMLCQSVVLSDRSTALEQFFIDKEDMVLFSLKEINTLPLIVNDLLKDEVRMGKIAESGCQKAMREHLWIHRVGELLKMLDE